MFAVIAIMAPTSRLPTVMGPFAAFLGEVARFTDHNHSLRASDSVWLIPLPGESPILTGVAAAADRYQIAYRILYFEKAPQEFGTPGTASH
jgi:hypothetical protein